jgi:hypothetical protein
MYYLKRNPFGRYTVVKESVGRDECDWCDSGVRWCWRYGRDNDGGRTEWASGKFCSKSCCESYHDTKL